MANGTPQFIGRSERRGGVRNPILLLLGAAAQAVGSALNRQRQVAQEEQRRLDERRTGNLDRALALMSENPQAFQAFAPSFTGEESPLFVGQENVPLMEQGLSVLEQMAGREQADRVRQMIEGEMFGETRGAEEISEVPSAGELVQRSGRLQREGLLPQSETIQDRQTGLLAGVPPAAQTEAVEEAARRRQRLTRAAEQEREAEVETSAREEEATTRARLGVEEEFEPTPEQEARRRALVAGAEARARELAVPLEEASDRAREIAKATAEGRAAGTPTGEDGDISESQRMARALVQPLDSIQQQLKEYENEIALTFSGIGAQEAMPNFLRSDDFQEYRAALEVLVQNITFALSGKQVSAQEMEQRLKALAPQPGDGQQAIQRKQQLRDQLIEAVKVMAALPTGQELENVDQEIRDLLDEFEGR